MDNAFSQLWQMGTLILGVTVYILTFFTRRIVEWKWPSLKPQSHPNEPKPTYLNKTAELYNTVILYAIPVTWGALIGLIPVDDLFGSIGTLPGRVFFGMVCGWFSSALYKTIKGIFKKNTGVDISLPAA